MSMQDVLDIAQEHFANEVFTSEDIRTHYPFMKNNLGVKLKRLCDTGFIECVGVNRECRRMFKKYRLIR